MSNILEKAQERVYGEQEEVYGHPIVNMKRIAALWSPILDVEVTPEQAALCMIATKIARQLNSHHRDNLVDIAGYASVIDRMSEDAPQRTEPTATTGTARRGAV